jgi:hypothetical protein
MSTERIIALDPSYVSKSGKYSDGVSYFWSEAAGQTKREQKFCGLAAVDLRDKTALNLLAGQPQEFPFSIADVKTRYVNETLGLRIIRGCGLSAEAPFIHRVLENVSKLGLRRA